jgi:hypothetical protein
VPKVLIEMLAHTNSFIFKFVMALLRQIGFYDEPTSLTTELRNSRTSKSTRRLAWANIRVAGSDRRAGGLLARLSAYPVRAQQDALSLCQQQPATRA